MKTATTTNASQPQIAVLRWLALQRPIREAKLLAPPAWLPAGASAGRVIRVLPYVGGAKAILLLRRRQRKSGRRSASTGTAARTSAPPTSWSGARVSPKARNASTTVTTGSTVARIEAAVGPARRRPAKKRPIAATVDTAAIEASQPQPARVTSPGRSSPSRADAVVRLIAAPVQTSAESRTGRIRPATPWLTSMYVA